ncbi:MAG: FKBP-type peptidyl-prolyl cis-trans isomerase [Candidatus Cryptobacteroides sp.]
MKRTNRYHSGAALLAASLLLIAFSCAKEASSGTNDDSKLYFDSWMKVHYPEVKPTGLGVYILEDTPGSGEALTDEDNYIFLRYTITDLDGSITGTTEEDVDKQLGNYSLGNYYGDEVFLNDPASTSAGLIELVRGMKVGGVRKGVIPGWLNVAEAHDTEQEYLDNCTGSDIICSITLTDKIDDIYKWEIDTLERFVARHMDGVDSTEFGYYYKQLRAPEDTASIPLDSTICINYIGRLMNGQVFDTTIKDTAKVWGIYSSSKEYAPVYITFESDFEDITMSSEKGEEGSTMVTGFSYCLSNMKKNEKGIVAFYSVHGYGTSGKGVIPKYAPISFEIELVEDPED